MATDNLPLALSITFDNDQSVISLTLFDQPTSDHASLPLELKFNYSKSLVSAPPDPHVPPSAC